MSRVATHLLGPSERHGVLGAWQKFWVHQCALWGALKPEVRRRAGVLGAPILARRRAGVLDAPVRSVGCSRARSETQGRRTGRTSSTSEAQGRRNGIPVGIPKESTHRYKKRQWNVGRRWKMWLPHGFGLEDEGCLEKENNSISS